MKIGILTTFSDLKPSYSLANVVVYQLKSLVKHGYQPVLYTLENFNDLSSVPSGVEIRAIVPQLLLEPYSSGDFKNLELESDLVSDTFCKHMSDIDVMLTHDIIFINSFLPYNLGMRKAIDTGLSNVKWLHWMHSGPSVRPILDGSPRDYLYTLPKNSKLVYMNHTDVVRAAEMYGVFPKDVRVIFNPIDVRETYQFHNVTREIIDEYDLMKPDILCIYPLSTTRMDVGGKQLSKVIITIAKIKEQGKSVCLVVPNAHANAKREKDAIERMYDLATKHGLERRELVFTSLHDIPKYESGVPHKVVTDLFLLGNLFIFPSVSENCPLVLLEAMLGKNILVLNRDFEAMRDFAYENALYFKFGSLTNNTEYHKGIENYLTDVAKIVVSEYENNKTIRANTLVRQKFSLDAVFKNQLEPAIKEIANE